TVETWVNSQWKYLAAPGQLSVEINTAAFANSPGFSKDEFQYVELASLTESVIFEYSEKWLDGRETDARERRDITAVLTQKLQQPHVRDLARNPMQLAILLNLISVRGASLPDKRTALYDSYIDIFLNREADKSEVVRDHRSELLKIHRFLAWLLQSEAESERGRGQITEQRLRQVLLQFLEDEGHATDLVGSLFQGVVERVFVLVSRVQGTFEFEVQPLREYFAARYLYDTAPYSPPGITVRGTLPDRFVALARNFYWLNVTRFFAGCYSSGELASLKYGIRLIQEDPDFNRMSHLPEMMLTLIKDYVFADQPLLSEEITELLIGDVFFSHLLARRIEDKPDVRLEVPRGRSRQVLVRHLVSLLTDNEKTDRSYVVSKSLGANLSPAELLVQWKELIRDIPDVKTQAWTAQITGLLQRVSVSQFREIFELVPTAAFNALQVGRVDVIDCDPKIWRTVLACALSQKHYYFARSIVPK
ncbi:NACHT domain-containing protein, partial [Rhizobium sophoriradicis]|uniref:NACHT domain-containing protein n=1 Tax=Rhizobium sophoriradicis TaxID=1535245 RepID=UPI001AED0D9B